MAVNTDIYVDRLERAVMRTPVSLVDGMYARLLIILLGFERNGRVVFDDEEALLRMFNHSVRKLRRPPRRTPEQLRRETWRWQLWFDRTFDFVQTLGDDPEARLEPRNDDEVLAWSDKLLHVAIMNALQGLMGIITLKSQYDQLPEEFVVPVQKAWDDLPALAEKIRTKLEGVT